MIVAPGSAMIVAPGSAIIAGPASVLSCPSDNPACVEQNGDTQLFPLRRVAKRMIVLAAVHCSHCPDRHRVWVWCCQKAKQGCQVKFTVGRRQ